MLKTGLLWFDDNPKRPLAEKLDEAAERYQERFDRWPTLVHLNPTQAEGLSVKYKRLRVFGDEHLRRNYFIVGVEEIDTPASVSASSSASPEQAAAEGGAEPAGVAAGAGSALSAQETPKRRRSRRQHSTASVSSVMHRRTRRAS